ncbi:MAG TPA: hypothetical protein VEK73_04910 [Xanthobacteraceae bacterium]|nr:hypothetical protein [Xanthobacteraceae bacterium]
MLPNFRFIAASVVASLAVMMFGFGLFAAFRLANQSSVVLARTGDLPAPPVFAQGREEEPAVAPSLEPVETAATPEAAPATAPDASRPAAEIAPAVVPDAPVPVVEAAPAPEPPVQEIPTPGQAAMPPETDAAAPAPAEIPPPAPAAAAATPEPAEAAPPAPSLAAPGAPPHARPLPADTTGSVKPDISVKEVRRVPAAAPQVKPKPKVAKPARKAVRRLVRRVVPPPQSAPPADAYSNWSTTNPQWSRQQLAPQPKRQ